MTNEQKKAILENVTNRLSNIDSLVQETIPHECLDIHTKIDDLIFEIHDIIDNL